MDNFIKVLQIIYYLIFIPLGILLIAFIIYLMVANPLGQLTKGMGGGPPGGFGGGGPAGGFGQQGGAPSEEMMEQFKQQQRGSGPDQSSEGGQFGGPSQR